MTPVLADGKRKRVFIRTYGCQMNVYDSDRMADVLRPLEPNAVTDVTGFGLFWHAHEVADRSGVRIRLESERFPAIDGALDLARKGLRTSGDPRNRDFSAMHV